MTARVRKWAWTAKSTVSTTSLMRHACEKANGDVAQAVAMLRGWTYQYPNAANAAKIIEARVHGAKRFCIDPRTAFIVAIAEEAA